jgi:hypothetical protein
LTEHQIEVLADEVLAAFKQTNDPVDLDRIASEEGIKLVEGEFGEDFHGRIEYLPEVETFVIYHPNAATSQYPQRVRFSIGHELGHYYIPSHRELLIKGMAHYSMEGFRHKNVIEHQADVFAAALLIPSKILRVRMGRRGFLSLPQILTLADDCRTSAQSTAFRYSRFAKEPHISFVSENGKVLYSFPSDEARAIGCGYLRNQSVPEGSSTQRALTIPGVQEGKIDFELWFSDHNASMELWEEAVRLGTTNRVLTLLSWVKYGKD